MFVRRRSSPHRPGRELFPARSLPSRRTMHPDPDDLTPADKLLRALKAALEDTADRLLDMADTDPLQDPSALLAGAALDHHGELEDLLAWLNQARLAGVRS